MGCLMVRLLNQALKYSYIVTVKTVMVHYHPLGCLPSSAELPDSDDTPVDNGAERLAQIKGCGI